MIQHNGYSGVKFTCSNCKKQCKKGDWYGRKGDQILCGECS